MPKLPGPEEAAHHPRCDLYDSYDYKIHDYPYGCNYDDDFGQESRRSWRRGSLRPTWTRQLNQACWQVKLQGSLIQNSQSQYNYCFYTIKKYLN